VPRDSAHQNGGRHEFLHAMIDRKILADRKERPRDDAGVVAVQKPGDRTDTDDED
jgi:hypothetical protein